MSIFTPPVPADLPGWEYRDTPSWVRHDFWGQLIDLIGEGNMRLIAMSRRQIDGEPYLRGQFFISPEGIANLRAHNGSADNAR